MSLASAPNSPEQKTSSSANYYSAFLTPFCKKTYKEEFSWDVFED